MTSDNSPPHDRMEIQVTAVQAGEHEPTNPLALSPPMSDAGFTRHFGVGGGPAAAQSAGEDESVVAGASNGRILIVEDEALVALDMAMILNSAGYQVMGTKPTGDSALVALSAAAADGIAPDLVLMDIALRGSLDGIETTRRIKAEHVGVPIAFVTGQADPITRARAEATDPVGYLLKPFTPEQLVNFIKTVLAGK